MSTVSRMVGAGAMVALAVAALQLTPSAQRSASPSPAIPKGEWRTYGADLASTRYSPLDQINGATSASSRWRGGSRPTTSARAPNSTSSRRR